MNHSRGKIFLAAATAGILLFTAACSAPKENQPGTSSGEVSTEEKTDGGKASYTDTYDPEALFKFGMTPVKDKETGKYGYKNEAGQWVIEPQFMRAEDFQVNKTAFVRTGSNKDEYRLIDRDGNFVSDYIFKSCTQELVFSPDGIAAGRVLQADGTELGKGYFYLENGEIVFAKRDETSISDFSYDGYAVLDGKQVIDKNFEVVMDAPEDIYIMSAQNGFITYRKGTGAYGYMDFEGKAVGDTSANTVSPFAENGLAVSDDKIIDKNWNVIFDIADSGYSLIASNFRNSDWVEVSRHSSNRGGTDFNFVNAQGELFLPADAYEHSHMDGGYPIKNDIYVGPAPVLKDAQGNITGVGESDEYATVAVNKSMEILYVPSEKGVQDVGAYHSDGYAFAENEDEEKVIIDREGNIVLEV